MFKSVIVIISMVLILSCSSNELSFTQGDLRIDIKEGEEWIHEFDLFLGFKKNNPPQFALWIEDLNGNYIETIIVTNRVSKGSWIANKGNKRVEALPVWTHSIGYTPTNDEVFSDGLTTATPKTGLPLKASPKCNLEKFVIKFEVNHSTDFNSSFPVDANVNNEGYSGGVGGSGQPALVYQGLVDMTMVDSIKLELIGHSSPDGTTGDIYYDISNITTALKIIEYVKVTKI